MPANFVRTWNLDSRCKRLVEQWRAEAGRLVRKAEALDASSAGFAMGREAGIFTRAADELEAAIADWEAKG